MRWDQNGRAKPLRRKHKVLLIFLSLLVALIITVVSGFVRGFHWDNSLDIITHAATSILNDDEKKIVWDSMSPEGKKIIKKHLPYP